MAQVSLAKAMKIKNRLAGRLARLTTQIQQGNSVIEGQPQPDVLALWAQREALVGYLIALKAALAQATVRIQHLLLEMQEKKATIALLQGLNTRDGDSGQVHYGTTQKIIFRAAIKQQDVNAWVEKLEQEIDALQDRVDLYNAQTKLDLDPAVLEAAGSQVPRD
ncbi:MAG TPA: hypothetical protein VFA26_25910 [Gemmataceae bacterium]|nr:hypothetical protein [Gemmataceae bacterium]